MAGAAAEPVKPLNIVSINLQSDCLSMMCPVFNENCDFNLYKTHDIPNTSAELSLRTYVSNIPSTSCITVCNVSGISNIFSDMSNNASGMSNASDMSINVSDMYKNVSGMSNIVSGMSNNVSGMSNNVSDMSINVSDTSNNVSGMSNNVSDMSVNVSDMSINVSDMANNVSDMSSNVSDMTNNVSDMSDNVKSKSCEENSTFHLLRQYKSVHAKNLILSYLNINSILSKFTESLKCLMMS